MISRLTAVLSAALLLQGAYALEPSSGIQETDTIETPCCTRTLHVINDLRDVCALLDMPDSQLQALENVIKKATVTVNGTTLKDGQSAMMTLQDEPIHMNIKLNGQAAQPFLRATGIATNLFFYLVQFEVSFDVEIEDDEDELHALFALVHKAEKWTLELPSITVSYRMPLTINVAVTDLVCP